MTSQPFDGKRLLFGLWPSPDKSVQCELNDWYLFENVKCRLLLSSESVAGGPMGRCGRVELSGWGVWQERAQV